MSGPVIGFCFDVDGQWWRGHGPGSGCADCDPKPRHTLDRLVDEGWKMSGTSHCRSCHDEIVWMVSPVDRNYPYNLDGTSHFSTCPHADRWRKS